MIFGISMFCGGLRKMRTETIQNNAILDEKQRVFHLLQETDLLQRQLEYKVYSEENFDASDLQNIREIKNILFCTLIKEGLSYDYVSTGDYAHDSLRMMIENITYSCPLANAQEILKDDFPNYCSKVPVINTTVEVAEPTKEETSQEVLALQKQIEALAEEFRRASESREQEAAKTTEAATKMATEAALAAMQNQMVESPIPVSSDETIRALEQKIEAMNTRVSESLNETQEKIYSLSQATEDTQMEIHSLAQNSVEAQKQISALSKKQQANSETIGSLAKSSQEARERLQDQLTSLTETQQATQESIQAAHESIRATQESVHNTQESLGSLHESIQAVETQANEQESKILEAAVEAAKNAVPTTPVVNTNVNVTKNVEKKIEKSVIPPSNEKIQITSYVEKNHIQQYEKEKNIDTFLYDEVHVDVLDPRGNISDQLQVVIVPLTTAHDDSHVNIMVSVSNKYDQISAISKETSAIVMKIGETELLIRGIFGQGDFETFVVATGDTARLGYQFNLVKVYHRPKFSCNYGHVCFNDNGFMFHISPLSTKNNRYGVAPVLIGVEKNDERRVFLSGDSSTTYLNTDDFHYQLLSYWKDNILCCEVLPN
jgi:hypothetical protein